MDRKENKRSLKSSPYFQHKPKKTKKPTLFSITSTPSIKASHDDALKKCQGSNLHGRKNRINNEISIYQMENPQKLFEARTFSARRHKHSAFKNFKE